MSTEKKRRLRLWLWPMLGVLLLAGAGLWADKRPTERGRILRNDSDEPGRVQRCRPGPWGPIEYLNIVIEAPEEAIAWDPPPHFITTWIFGEQTLASLPAVLRAAGLDARDAAELMAAATPLTNAVGVAVRPSDRLLLGLSPTTREHLYAALSETPGNTSQRYPFRFEAPDLERWFEEANLAPDLRDLLRRLTYRRGQMLLLSDHFFLLDRIPTVGERKALMRALYRQPTLLLHIGVQRDTTVEELIAYWGGHGREADVQPLLEGLERIDDDWPIGVTPLLPPLPRQKIYTYDTGQDGHFRDCHWTSMNFFNAEPDDRFLDIAYVKQFILDHYQRVTSDYKLGDLILLRDRAGHVVHSCNYVADHLVFTKNGGERAQPWVIMTLEDLVQYYSVSEPLEILFLRKRD